MKKNVSEIKQAVSAFLITIFPIAFGKLQYWRTYHTHCNLKKPQTFSEKLLWLKHNIYCASPLIQTVGDKYLVRKYLSSLGYDGILNELYFAWTNEADIDWDQLPEQFVMKLSVGCSTNLFCPNKTKFDVESAKKQLAQWMHPSYFVKRSRFIGKPHEEMIICEKYLGTPDGGVPRDYKFYCFNGEPKAILVIDDRYSAAENGALMSLKWEIILDLSVKYPNMYCKASQLFEKPIALDQMIEIARALSQPFPFMRIDLYEIDGQVYFGEFTMCPLGCIGVAETDIDGKTMGELLDISDLLQREENE